MKNATIRLVLLEEAVAFLDSLPDSAKDKVLYNIHRVVNKEQRSVQEIGKLRHPGIPDTLQQDGIQALRFLGYWNIHPGRRNTWDCKKDTKDTGKGNCQG